MGNYDVIIIGAGHNGLVTAAYLAKGGRRVLVLEKRKPGNSSSVVAAPPTCSLASNTSTRRPAFAR